MQTWSNLGVMVAAMVSARLPHTLLRNTLSVVVVVLIGGKLAWPIMGNYSNGELICR